MIIFGKPYTDFLPQELMIMKSTIFEIVFLLEYLRTVSLQTIFFQKLKKYFNVWMNDLGMSASAT